MMTAEQWYEYQDRYKKYGIDMKPQRQRAERAVRKEAAAPVISARDRRRALICVLLAGIVCVGVIIATAYAASIKNDMNAIIRENAEITSQIEDLTVQLKNATAIQTIEDKAINELGMIYPTSDQCVYLAQIEEPTQEFAIAVREIAYNR